MIVVVEGPSAAGKTTWAEAHVGASLVPEQLPRSQPPAARSAAAAFWAEHGATRWASAVRIEQRQGIAVCDTDPLKLHYAWSLWRIGVANAEEFERQAAAYRKMVDHRRIGFADRYLVSIPDPLSLDSRRSADRSRRRRNFELHVRLAGPLREWYEALEHTRPGSVVWELKPDALKPAGELPNRYELNDCDALLGLLRST